MIRTVAAALATTTCLVAPAVPAAAQSNEYDIPAGPLRAALDAFARQSGRQVIYQGDVRLATSQGVRGARTAEDALTAIVIDTGFTVRTDTSGAFAIVKLGNVGSDSGLPPGSELAMNLASQADALASVDEIIVTANKSRQRLIDVPSSVTAETGAQLRRRGAVQLQDIIATTPGLTNPSPGSGNNTNLVMRGVTTDTALNLKQSTVSVLFDDIPVDPAVSGLLTTNLRIVDIERVEVLRGPQGTLFGSGSLSGSVRYITNKPDASRLSASVEGSLTGTRSSAVSDWGNVVLNVPILKDRVAVRAVGYGFDEGGWIDNISSGRKNVNRNKTFGGRVALAVQATDSLSMSLTGVYQDSRDYGQNDSLYFQPTGYSQQVKSFPNEVQSELKTTIANLGLVYDFGSVSMFSSSTYIHRQAETRVNAFYYTDLVQAQFGLPPLDNTTPSRVFNNSNVYMQELRLASNGTGAFRWTFGGFYLRSVTPDGGQTVSSPGLAPYLGTDNLIRFEVPGKQEEFAGFGEATYSLAHKLDLTAGVRVSRTTIDISSIASGLLITGSPAALPPFRSLSKETAVNPRFSVLYRPIDQVSVYLQAARGYRVGGANNTAVLGGPDIPRAYGSDSLWNYEAGVKTNLLDGRLQLNADVYYIDWKNLQVSLVANGFAFTGNAGTARIYGFEAEIAAKPSSWLDLGGSLSLNNAALTKDAPTLVRSTGIVGAEDGDRLPGSPRVQGSVYAQLNFRHGDDKGFVRASGQYVGSSYTDFASQGIRFGDYGTVDLRAGIAHDNVELTIFVRNLLDGDGKQAAAEAASFNGVRFIDQLAYRVRPRTIGLTGRVEF